MIWLFDVFFYTRDVIKWAISPAAHFTMASRPIPAYTDDHAQNHKVATFQAVRFTIAPRLSFHYTRPHRGLQYGQDRVLILVRDVQHACTVLIKKPSIHRCRVFFPTVLVVQILEIPPWSYICGSTCLRQGNDHVRTTRAWTKLCRLTSLCTATPRNSKT
jgi:hypothetical protein